MRGGEFIFVNSYSCQGHASSQNTGYILIFRFNWQCVEAMNVFVEKDILISGFLALSEVKVLGKVLIVSYQYSHLHHVNIISIWHTVVTSQEQEKSVPKVFE